jgi:hypothetical protein
MRSFLRLFGVVIFILGILGVFGSRLMTDQQHETGVIMLWGGLATAMVGWVVSSTARNKTCANCQARVEAEANHCARCGNAFG